VLIVAYDEHSAERVRRILAERQALYG